MVFWGNNYNIILKSYFFSAKQADVEGLTSLAKVTGLCEENLEKTEWRIILQTLR